MIRIYLASLCLMLTGCCLWNTGLPTDTTPTNAAIDLYADKADLVMSRAAAAVLAAKKANQNQNPKAVENELSVAEAYLPRPKRLDEEFASKRVASSSDSEYSKAVQIGDEHQRDLDEKWDLVVAERQRSQNNADAKALELIENRKLIATYALTGIGGICVLAGIGMMLFGWNKVNASISIAIGSALIGAVWVFDAPWFGWVAACSLLLVALEAYRRYRNSQRMAPQPKQVT